MGEILGWVQLVCPKGIRVNLDLCGKCRDMVDILRNGEDYEVKVICDYRECLQREKEGPGRRICLPRRVGSPA